MKHLYLLAFCVVALGASGCEPPETHGTRIDPPMEAPDFILMSDQGEVSRSDLEGRFTIVFFGFTQCPDICPDTMVRLRHALADLSPREAEQVQVVLVSLDPERDDPTTVAAYARTFGDRFIGVTGDSETIAALAADYGIYHRKVSLGDDNYTVDHTAFVTVLNRQAERVLIWRYGLAPDEMASDLRFLLSRP